MRIAIIILLVVLFQGCVTATREEIAGARFGALPADYQQRVRTFLSSQITLRPETATYEFLPPRKGMYQTDFVGKTKRFGWIVPVSVRVKNHFGLHVSGGFCVFIGADGKLEDCTAGMGQLARYVD